MNNSIVVIAIAIATLLSCAFAQNDRLCKLRKDPSVTYYCVEGDGSRVCEESVPSGTVVRPECSAPVYYYSGTFPFMRCIDGSWDYIAKCLPECGTPSPMPIPLDSGSDSPDSTELPWHGAVYKKTTTPYQFRCAVTLVTKKVVLSAAHCFWDGVKETALKAEDFAVAVGKTHRPWAAPEDQHAQKSDNDDDDDDLLCSALKNIFSQVAEIKLPARFRGGVTNYQDDLAVLVLAKEITFSPHVRPVCLDFNVIFERQQLKENSLGKVASWGGIKPSKTYKVTEMMYFPIEQCIAESPPDFREFLTSDKICTGFTNGTGLCRGDGGAGLSFPSMERGRTRYYLRGLVSTAPTSSEDFLCTENSLQTYTQISKHELFIKENINTAK
ncbi:modular serine protease-like [Ostrinia furnacalis]|uniref:modular serine protease-like n=1 Tax=Ostrinia furnacalis TaxID=93504 RepID=UPI00103C8CA6|nr:modular serine protease-like [Ostrinia furnacalis]